MFYVNVETLLSWNSPNLACSFVLGGKNNAHYAGQLDSLQKENFRENPQPSDTSDPSLQQRGLLLQKIIPLMKCFLEGFLISCHYSLCTICLSIAWLSIGLPYYAAMVIHECDVRGDITWMVHVESTRQCGEEEPFLCTLELFQSRVEMFSLF